MPQTSQNGRSAVWVPHVYLMQYHAWYNHYRECKGKKTIIVRAEPTTTGAIDIYWYIYPGEAKKPSAAAGQLSL